MEKLNSWNTLNDFCVYEAHSLAFKPWWSLHDLFSASISSALHSMTIVWCRSGRFFSILLWNLYTVCFINKSSWKWRFQRTIRSQIWRNLPFHLLRIHNWLSSRPNKASLQGVPVRTPAPGHPDLEGCMQVFGFGTGVGTCSEFVMLASMLSGCYVLGRLLDA